MSFNHSQETGVKLVLFLNLLKKERKVGLKDEKIYLNAPSKTATVTLHITVIVELNHFF